MLAADKILAKKNKKSEPSFKLQKSSLIGGSGVIYKIIDYDTNEDLCHIAFAEKEIKMLYSFNGCEINKLEKIIDFIKKINFCGE